MDSFITSGYRYSEYYSSVIYIDSLSISFLHEVTSTLLIEKYTLRTNLYDIITLVMICEYL